jgi:hypothetical protein
MRQASAIVAMALVSLALAHAGAQAQAPPPFANPLYRQWVGFAVGTSVTLADQRWVVGQRGSRHIATQQLVSSSPDEIVVT